MSEAAVRLRTGGLVKEFAGPNQRFTLYRLLRSRLNREAWTRPRLRSLDGIDLEGRAGELIGIVGVNGAGKTTLLKTIAGLYAPTRGRVEVFGEVTLVAGLGAGMMDELSVADNVRLYGAVCRIHRRTIERQFGEILRWAEVEEFVDAELRTLSTGMRTRLAFSIARNIESEVILLDEAFSAGDKRFEDRCDEYFRDVAKARRTLLVATHNLDFVRTFCQRTLWLHHGRQMALGPTGEVLPRYLDFVGH